MLVDLVWKVKAVGRVGLFPPMGCSSDASAQCMTDDENPMCTVRALKLY